MSRNQKLTLLNHSSRRHLLIIGLATASLLASKPALAQYNWVNTSNQSGNWNTAARWTGGAAGTFPNAIDATATLTQPLSTAPSGVYNVQISSTAGQAITIGGLTVNNSSASTGNLRIGGNGDGTITFQSSSGPAFYTENAYPSEPTSGVFTTNIFAPVTFASDTVITQNHALNDNGGTAFTSNANSAGGVTAALGITVTKAGAGNVEFDVAPTAPATGFQGALVINAGAVRDTVDAFQNASSITVNSGGQYQLGANLANWNLAPGAVLNLNGSGKASGVNTQGALRENNSTAVTNFNAPINLQSTASVDVTGTAQLTFTQAVSGVGGLTKTDPGTLILGGTAANTYGGTTHVSGGTLVLDKPDGTTAIPGDISVQAASNTIQGVLQLGANNQIADSANVTLNQSTGTGTPNGLFALNGFHDTIGSLSSTGGAGIVQNGAAAGSSTLTIDAALSSSNFTGLIQDGGAASLALSLLGTQGLTLTGASTYSGGTTVSGGSLIVNNATGSATGSGAVALSAASTLAGSGFIAGSVNFAASTLAPSNGLSTPQTLTLGGATFDAVSTASYQLGAPAQQGAASMT